MESQQAIDLLCQYISIKTVHPCPDYRTAVNFLKDVAIKYIPNVSLQEIEFVKDKPMLLLTVPGGRAGSILLSSHMDVVPVTEEKWTTDPFGGIVTADGFIYGRGSQDMKCIGIAYIAALSRMLNKSKGQNEVKTFHLLFTVDEEIGSCDGVKKLFESGFFKDLDITVALDEGLPSPFPDRILVFRGERPVFTVKMMIAGNAGHGSVFIQNAAVEKLSIVLQRIYDFRKSELKKMSDDRSIGQLGKVTTVNVNMIQAGKQWNVVPDSVELTIDIRVSHELGLEGIKGVVDGWTSGLPGVQWTGPNQPLGFELTDSSHSSYRHLSKILEHMSISMDVEIFPGGTDSRFFRACHIPVLSFSPFRGCTPLLHDHNEKLLMKAFVEGIDIYERLLDLLSC